MSLRSKIFLGTSIASAAIIIPWVHFVQQDQRNVLHEGPIRDAARRSQKLNAVQLERAAEYEEQKRLRKELSAEQEVSSQ